MGLFLSLKLKKKKFKSLHLGLPNQLLNSLTCYYIRKTNLGLKAINKHGCAQRDRVDYLDNAAVASERRTRKG